MVEEKTVTAVELIPVKKLFIPKNLEKHLEKVDEILMEASGETFEQKLKFLADSALKIAVEDSADYDLVKKKKLALGKLRTGIKKLGKAWRDTLTAQSRAESKEEKRLLAIFSGAEEDLENLLEKIDKANEKAKRAENLEMYKESLSEISANPLTDDEILSMDKKEFFAHLEAEKMRITALKQDFQGRILNAKNLEELGLVEENITLCGYSEFNDALKNRAVQLQNALDLEAVQQKIKDDQKKLDDEKLKIEQGKEVEEAKKTAREEAELKAKNDAETARLKVIEDAKIAKQKADDEKKHLELEHLHHTRVAEAENLGIREFLKTDPIDSLGELSIAEWTNEREEALNQKKENDVKIEQDKKDKDLSEKTALEKNEKYSAFLEKNGRTLENTEDFDPVWNEKKTICVLWKRIATLEL